MDESEYRAFHDALTQRPCPFEKAILSSRCACAKAQRLNIAEREAVICTQQASRLRCLALLDALRHNARFALRQTQISDALPHGKEMKIQCGGLQGLYAAVFPEAGENTSVDDIAALIDQALTCFGALDKLPYSEIVRYIAHYQVRKRTRKADLVS